MPNATVFDDILDLALARDVARRPTLVRVIVDGFCRDESPRSAAEIRQFEELMGHLLGQVDAFTRAVAAQKLARRRDVPGSLIERLAAEDEVCEPILAHSPLVTGELIDRAIAAGGSSARAALLRRSDLTAAQRAALDAPTAPPTASAPPPAPAPAVPEAGRDDALRPAPFDLFAAPPEERRATLHRLSATAIELSVEPAAPERRKNLVRLAVLRQREAFAAALADMLAISPGIARRIADDPDGEPLVVAARALGFDIDALAQLLLLVNPAVGESYEKVTRLRDLFRLVSAEAASAVIVEWRNAPIEPRRTGERATTREPSEAAAVVPFRERGKDRASGS